MTEVLQVRIDEPGGGKAHVELLIRRLPASVRTEEVVIPRSWARGFPRWGAIGRLLTQVCAGKQVIHAHGIRAAFTALPTARSRRLPLVATVHGVHAVRRGGWSRPLAAIVTRWILTRCDRVLTLSNEDHAMLLSLGIADEKIQDIDPLFEAPPAYERTRARSELGIDEASFVALWVGRFEEEKDPLTFVRAVALTDARGIVAIMAGDGSLAETVHQAAASTGRRFLLPGWTEEMASFYSAADLFVSTSLWEAAPLAPFEAAASGLPLVVTDAPGNERFISSGMAVAFPPGDATHLASLIKELHDDPEERIERAAGSARGVRSISLHETPELLGSIYIELADRL